VLEEAVNDFHRDVEDFLFMEEDATKLMVRGKALGQRVLAEGIPDVRSDLAAGVRLINHGLSSFHSEVLTKLSAGLDALDDVLTELTIEDD
jgi:hypothetical protein